MGFQAGLGSKGILQLEVWRALVIGLNYDTQSNSIELRSLICRSVHKTDSDVRFHFVNDKGFHVSKSQ